MPLPLDNLPAGMGQHDREEMLAIVRATGWAAADILRSYETADLQIEDTGDGPVTAADKAANDCILNNLQAAFGTRNCAYLSEETFKSQPAAERLGHDWVWIIDPLDGTKDFIKRTGEYALHIALAYQGRPVLAVVACPGQGKLYYAAQGQGTFLETRDAQGQFHSQPARVSSRDRFQEMTIVASRSHRNPRFNQLLEKFPVQQQRQVGSVGGKIAAIVDQTADLYLALSGDSAPKDWDFAAPELILTEAGGQFTRFDGSLLQYNREDVVQWGGILASNGTCHAKLGAEAERILQNLG